MNKYGLLVIIIFASQQIQAQTEFVPETTVGVKWGSNLSSLLFEPTVEQNLKSGYVGGLAFKHISQKGLGVLAEINYTQVGWDEKTDSIFNYSRQLNYIHIPFMTHVTLGRGNFKFNINLGPNIAYLASEKSTTNLEEQMIDSTYYAYNAENKIDFGLCAGLGFIQHTGIGNFQLEGRFYLGFGDVFEQNDIIRFSSSKNQNIEISLSYFLDPKKIFGK